MTVITNKLAFGCSAARSKSFLLWKQLADGNVQCFGDIGQDAERRVPLAALQPGDVGPMMFGLLGQFLLAPSTSLPQRPNALS